MINIKRISYLLGEEIWVIFYLLNFFMILFRNGVSLVIMVYFLLVLVLDDLNVWMFILVCKGLV